VSLFLPVRRGQSSSIGICARCRVKMYLSELKSDPNAPGLLVCEECSDVLDPYRKPQRTPENITLRMVRPDESIEYVTDYSYVDDDYVDSDYVE